MACSLALGAGRLRNLGSAEILLLVGEKLTDGDQTKTLFEQLIDNNRRGTSVGCVGVHQHQGAVGGPFYHPIDDHRRRRTLSINRIDGPQNGLVA